MKFNKDTSRFCYDFENDFDYNKIYLKVIRKDKKHRTMVYKKGINIDVLKFNSNLQAKCVPGRLYFTNLKNIFSYFNYGELIALIRIRKGERVIHEGNKCGVHKFEILEFMTLNEFLKSIEPITVECDAYFNNLKSLKGLEKLKKKNKW